MYPKKTKNVIRKDMHTSMFIASSFTVAKYGNNLNVH